MKNFNVRSSKTENQRKTQTTKTPKSNMLNDYRVRKMEQVFNRR